MSIHLLKKTQKNDSINLCKKSFLEECIMAKLKAAIIGTGGISNEHIMAYQKNENVELYAFCDINEKQLNLMAEKYGVPKERCFLDKDEMLKALPEIDIVSVCTWNSAHAECSIAALNAGCHVFCEKPMAMNT